MNDGCGEIDARTMELGSVGVNHRSKASDAINMGGCFQWLAGCLNRWGNVRANV